MASQRDLDPVRGIRFRSVAEEDTLPPAADYTGATGHANTTHAFPPLEPPWQDSEGPWITPGMVIAIVVLLGTLGAVLARWAGLF